MDQMFLLHQTIIIKLNNHRQILNFLLFMILFDLDLNSHRFILVKTSLKNIEIELDLYIKFSLV